MGKNTSKVIFGIYIFWAHSFIVSFPSLYSLDLTHR
jgi:hypothetical protein